MEMKTDRITTIRQIFYSMLQGSAPATAYLVFWPVKATVQVQATMPKCFHPTYSDT